MIKYISSRGQDNKKYKFSESLLKGIASDNGLLTPEKIPSVSKSELKNLTGKSYQDVALFIFKKFETDFSDQVLKKIINTSHRKNFDNSAVTPVVKLKDNHFLLELWHGPTAAFKDIALQIMPLLFLEALKKSKQTLNYLVLAATSGDTGKAALEGYKNLKNFSIIVLYPKDKVAKLQELQMTTQHGKNVEVIAVKGDFDKTQNLVKEIFADAKFNNLLEKQNVKLTSANSINWGRLIPQIVYYFVGYLSLVQNDELKLGKKINIAVPTGNFGNILAAFIAKQMGLPINKLICATNENNAVSKFLETGTYDISGKQMKSTNSPAMDILIASNIERLLFFITKNPNRVAEWMNQLKNKKHFSVDKSTLGLLHENFYSTWISNEATLKTIKDNYLKNNYLFDPHTAIAVKATEEFSAESAKEPILISSTAHWSKFPSAIYQALGLKSTIQNEFGMLAEISHLKNVSPVPGSIGRLKDKPIKFNKVISPDLNDLKESILTHLSNVKT